MTSTHGSLAQEVNARILDSIKILIVFIGLILLVEPNIQKTPTALAMGESLNTPKTTQTRLNVEKERPGLEELTTPAVGELL